MYNRGTQLPYAFTRSSEAAGPTRSWHGRVVLFACALLLPILASAITARVSTLHLLPFSLHFLILLGVALFGGFAPAVLALLVSLLSNSYYLQRGILAMPTPWIGTIRVAIMFLFILIIASYNRGRQRSRDKLESVLSALQERTDVLVQSLLSSKCASWTIDFATDQCVHWYTGSFQIFGQPFEPRQGLASLSLLIHTDDQPRFVRIIEHMRSSWHPIRFEYRVVWPNGELHWLECRGTRIPHRQCLWHGVTVDITERMVAEAALLRAEKLAAMGRLASTVAHEINNPLEAVTNLLYLARTEVASNCANEACDAILWLETAEKELARLSNITRLTLGFVRTSASSSTVDLSESIEDVLSIFRHRYEMKEIRVDRELEPAVAVNLPPHELRQIATNLVANAIDALSEPHARIIIRVHREPHAGPAVLTLEDNGVGIPPHLLPRIFEAFFSTKLDVGTGIGLWVTKELVEKNGGRISVQSGNLDNGMRTRFRVELPRASAPSL